MNARIFEDLHGLAASGRYDDAEPGLLALLEREPGHVEAAALLAWIAQQRGDGAACERWLAAVFALDPDHRAALTIRIALASDRAQWPEAEAAATRLVALEPELSLAHYNLGATLARGGEVERATAALDRAVALAPDAIEPLLARGWLALERGVPEAACSDFERVVALAPMQGVGWIRLGVAELRRYRGAPARAAFERATGLAPTDAAGWRGLAQANELLGHQKDALAASERALALAPDSATEALDHAQCLARQGAIDDAIAAAARSAALDSSRLVPRWLQFQLMPFVYHDAEDIDAWRERWRAGLAGFEALDLETPGFRDQLPEVLNVLPNFHRHYLGDDVTTDQRRYGALIARMARTAFAEWPAPALDAGRRRLRVGFASAHLRRHTIWKLFHQWLALLDRNRFEVVALYLGPVVDDTVLGLASIADRVLGPLYRNQEWIAAIRAAELDALVYLDVGMDGLTQLLAPLRLAPVQCASWGHPITTGLDSIDHFISGAAMEPPDGAAHYTEKLVQLPGLGILYPMPEAARSFVRAPRSAATSPRFICAQSVYKLLPAHDALFARIAARVPGARFEFIPHPVAEVRQRLAARMRSAFARQGVAFDACVTLHPYQPEAQFMERLASADVLLDTLDWSGGNTTLEALALDLPVVTLPGAFMRARHTHAMLKILGLDGELSARDPDHYVEIAVRLASDTAFHARMVAAIRERKHLLFDDPTPIRALEDFLWSACGRSSEP